MRRLHQLSAFALVLAVTGPALFAATGAGEHWCGTSPYDIAVYAARHDYFARHFDREGRQPFVKTHDGTVRQEGDVAVIEDDGTLFIAPRPFDLGGSRMQFLRRRAGMSAVRSPLDFKNLIGDKLPLGDDDSFRVDFPAGFDFPFGEEVYTGVWVNSDGSLTFRGPDTTTDLRSLSRFLDRGPAIAPLFTDLDPSQAVGEGGVYLIFLPHRVRVTWLEVPEFGIANRSSVQVNLFDNGRVTFAFGEVQAGEAIVGMNPWGGTEPLHLMDFNAELPFPPERVAIAEHFPAAGPQTDEWSIPIRFFQHFQDVYDEVMVFYAFSKNLGANVLGQSLTVNNEIRGIGEDIFDASDMLGSQGRLHSFVEMAGNIMEDYPNDPAARLGNNGLTTLGLMAHEVGHRWLAQMTFIHPVDGSRSSSLLGRQQSHWSFFMHSGGSALEGNDIVDNGDGTFTTRGPVEHRYSALDQYAMGLVPASRVPPFFYVANASAGAWNNESNPRAGVTITGDRRNVTIEDIIAAEGQRVPPSANAPKVFRIAFVLVGPPGGQAPPQAINKVERFRRSFEDYFVEKTDGNGRVLTELLPR